MAINKVDYPANLTDQADFSAHGTLIEGRYLDQSAVPLQVIAGNIPQGVVFQIGGVVYSVDSDTAITGTASDYVKIVPAGATATAEYVASLTGVTWTSQYNGYYDASGNLYIFDEGKALAAGEITAVFGRYLAQQANGDVAVGRNLDVAGDAAVGGNATIGGTIDTGLGATEVYPMDQSMLTTADVNFNTGVFGSYVDVGGQLDVANRTFLLGETTISSNLLTYTVEEKPFADGATAVIYSSTIGPTGYASSGIVNVMANTWGSGLYHAVSYGVSFDVVLLNQIGSLFSPDDSGIAIRVYWSGDVLYVKNSTGGSVDIRVTFIGTGVVT